MKKVAARRQRGKRTLANRRNRRPQGGPQSLLILHLDANKLRLDGLHLGDVIEFSGTLARVALGAQVVIEDATTTHHLHQLLADLVSKKKTFDVIAVVAHSNAGGIRVADDRFVTWDAFAGYLKPFKPRRLLLVACKAGRWNAGEVLFKSVPRLRRIFACPVIASKDFGALMLFAVPYVVAERRPKDTHVLWSQLASIAGTGRQLREWRRTVDKGTQRAQFLTSSQISPIRWPGRYPRHFGR